MRENYYRTPFDYPAGPTELQEAVLGLLEKAEIDLATIDEVMTLIWQAERLKWEKKPAPPIQ